LNTDTSFNYDPLGILLVIAESIRST